MRFRRLLLALATAASIVLWIFMLAVEAPGMTEHRQQRSPRSQPTPPSLAQNLQVPECNDAWFTRKCQRARHDCTHVNGTVWRNCRRTCAVCGDPFVPEPFSEARLDEHIRVGAATLTRPMQQSTNAGADEAHDHWAHLISPTALGMPALGADAPEEFFVNHLLPALPHEAGPQLIVDVGANVGQFAFAIAGAGHDGLCFEAAPRTCHQLQRSVSAHEAAREVERTIGALRGSVAVRCVAVGARPGHMGFSTSSRLNASFQGTTKGSRSEHAKGRIEVPVVTLDAELPTQSMLLLKSDTQGSHRRNVEWPVTQTSPVDPRCRRRLGDSETVPLETVRWQV